LLAHTHSLFPATWFGNCQVCLIRNIELTQKTSTSSAKGSGSVWPLDNPSNPRGGTARPNSDSDCAAAALPDTRSLKLWREGTTLARSILAW
jgi:hypothetical protein